MLNQKLNRTLLRISEIKHLIQFLKRDKFGRMEDKNQGVEDKMQKSVDNSSEISYFRKFPKISCHFGNIPLLVKLIVEILLQSIQLILICDSRVACPN